jgi:hypothetical protein
VDDWGGGNRPPADEHFVSCRRRGDDGKMEAALGAFYEIAAPDAWRGSTSSRSVCSSLSVREFFPRREGLAGSIDLTVLGLAGAVDDEVDALTHLESSGAQLV